MKDVYVPVQAEVRPVHRRLTIDPSPEMDRLLTDHPEFFGFESPLGRVLCDQTPVNMVASLALMKHGREFHRYFNGSRLHKGILRPVELLENIPIVQPKNLGIAPLALYKRGVGAHSAVILNGPLAGGILEWCDQSRSCVEGMDFSRVWNEDAKGNWTVPLPDFVTELRLGDEEDMEFMRHFYAVVNSYRKVHGSQTGVFFDLLFEIYPELSGIVDPARFHTTESVPVLA